MKKLVMVLIFLISHSVFAEDIFRLQTKIAGQVFNDILVVDSYPSINTFVGTLTSPGLFSFPIENGHLSMQWVGNYLNFNVNIHENNKVYKVSYSILVQDVGTSNPISGKIFKEGIEIGSISGIQIFKDKK